MDDEKRGRGALFCPGSSRDEASARRRVQAWCVHFHDIALHVAECVAGTDVDFYWLGRVPCRNVRVLGLLVGVVPLETRVVYSGTPVERRSCCTVAHFWLLVDDGTGVVDCIHYPQIPPPSPQKPTKDGRPPPAKPPVSIKPLAWVGCTVKITGRVNAWYENKQIKVHRIGETLFFPLSYTG